MKEKMGVGLGCTVLLLLALVCIPASAGEQIVTSDAATCALIDELWGQNISVGEYFEQAHPEVLAEMPDDVRSEIYEQKMTWPETTVADENSLVGRLTSLRDSFLDCTAHMSMEYYQNNPNHPLGISFGGTTQTSETVPYLYLEVFLRNDDDQTEGSTAHSVNNAAHDSAENLVTYPPNDRYYTYVWSYCTGPYHEDWDSTNTRSYPW